MDDKRLPYKRYPKVPLERRAWAFVIDFATIWIISLLAGSAIQWILFPLGWFGMRIVLVDRNKGQTLGRWALDMKVLDAKSNKLPPFNALIKRELIVGGISYLAMIGLNIGLKQPLSMLFLLCPLLINAGVALADEQLNQAIHDRVAETIVIQTRRGFSLDIRLKKFWLQMQHNMRK